MRGDQCEADQVSACRIVALLLDFKSWVSGRPKEDVLFKEAQNNREIIVEQTEGKKGAQEAEVTCF